MATFKRYLMYQAMMFVFGIVGPIFLIVFFASQPDPSMKWFYWVGLFVTAADVLIALALTANNGRPNKTPADVRLALAVAKRVQSRGESDHASSSPQWYEAFPPTASSSNDYSSSGDSSSSSTCASATDSSSSDSGSSCDSGSSSSSD